MQLDFELIKEEKKVRSLMKTVKWEQNFPEIFNYDKASCKLAQYKIKGIIKRGKKNRSLMKTVKWGQNFPETFNYDKASCKLVQYEIKGKN